MKEMGAPGSIPSEGSDLDGARLTKQHAAASPQASGFGAELQL